MRNQFRQGFWREAFAIRHLCIAEKQLLERFQSG